MSDPRELPKAYDASQVEDGIYAAWEAAGWFNPDKLPERNQAGEPYAVVMPPPNVTGVLHLGHAFEESLLDTMIRFQRMRGKRVLLVPGTDHAAIATQARVEKNLQKEGMEDPRKTLGREGLLEKIRDFAAKSQSTILGQMRKTGISCDWSRLAYTLDESRSRAVRELFVKMYRDGLIYRGYRVVNWTVKGQSTCSDDEIVHVERSSKLYTFKYAKDFPITIATTRPETKLGDTAVAVHPSDEQYRDLIGKTFTVDVGAAKPLEIKIIADEGVDPAFGTGALGVTPAHSVIDFAMFEKQKAKGDPIELIPVIGTDGRMTEAAGSKYAGLTTEEAREKFVAWLKAEGLLEKEEEILQNVGTSDRFGDIVEAIPMTQWWLDVNKEVPGRGKTLRMMMDEAVRSHAVQITPERFEKLYFARVENLRDWCLSRQIWWGHRIPVWYRGEEIHVDIDAPTGEGWEQDPDTLDTWFSSGMWTFSTMGWPNPKIWEEHRDYHPNAWIQMGYEILYLWLMRMILLSTYATGEVPFKEAYIHGIVRDEKGQKFSKSLGNGIDPILAVQQYGCDALRWSLIIGTTPGNDSRFSDEKIESARNLVNKLWNISRYILMQEGVGETTADQDSGRQTTGLTASLADRWILVRLSEVASSVTRKLEAYEFSAAGEELRAFTWNDLADWYLEIAKIEKGKGAILRHILRTLLSLWHPFMPFVTEFAWKQAGFEGDLIVAPWPLSKADSEFGSGANSVDDLARFEQLRMFIGDLRRLRAEQGIEASKTPVFAIVASDSIVKMVQEHLEIVKTLTRASELRFESAIPEGWATLVGDVSNVAMDLSSVIDVEKEKQKLSAERDQLMHYVTMTEAKLANAEFASKAPQKVRDEMAKKLEDAKSRLKAITERMGSVG